MLAVVLASCTTIPERRFAIRNIDFEGNDEIASDEIAENIASRESPRFLGLFGGVLYDHEVFNRYVLETDLQRIERYYRARGFYRARVRAGRVDYVGKRHVSIEIIVEEGPPVVVREIDVHGLDTVPDALAAEAESAVTEVLEPGDRLEESTFTEAEDALRRALADNGYAHVMAKRRARVDLPSNTAVVEYWIDPGPVTRYGGVTIEGLGPIPEEPVRRALNVTLDDPYSQSELEEAERALLDLGVFATVSVKADLTPNEPGTTRAEDDPETNAPREAPPDGEQTKEEEPAPRDEEEPAPRDEEEPFADLRRSDLSEVVPVRVRAEPAKLRSVHLGGGVSADALRTDAHLVAGWEHQNLLGGLQHFMVEVVPGVVLYPTRIPELQSPQEYLPQARIRTEFRNPGVLEARTNAVIRAQGSMYPVLLTSEPSPEAPILGYQDLRASVGLERTLGKAYGALSHNAQMNRPFTYRGTLDDDLGTALVSYPELLARLDLRDDSVTPHSGAYFANTLQVAGVGGDAVDVKIEPEARLFIPLGRRLTLASRAAVGLLFPQNYGSTVLPNALDGEPGGASRAAWVRDIQLMFLRGLFSGGPSSNRGYRQREISPHGVIPFYNPGQSSAEIIEECTPNSAGLTTSECRLPIGGFTLWEASLELRFPVYGPLRGAAFADASDVSPRQLDFRFDRLHLSVGAGARYDTPVGPVRLDVGYRIPGLQAPQDARGEVDPDEVFGLPIAIALGIGVPF